MLAVHSARHRPLSALTYALWNPADKSGGVILTNGNRTASIVTTPEDGGSVRSTIGKSTGKWYWEMLCLSSRPVIGVATAAHPVAGGTYPGVTSAGWSYYVFNAAKYNSGGSASYGTTATAGDVIGVALNMVDGELRFYKNGVDMGVAFTGLPVGTPVFAITGNYTLNVDLVTANFGASAFAHSVPGGYNPGLYN